MNFKTMTLTVVLGASLACAGTLHAQNVQIMTRAQMYEKDSVDMANLKHAQLQQEHDDTRMADAKQDRRETKAKAKTARRVENEANAAARESRSAVRSERKAQKARRQANKQADKAAEAIEKSGKN
jgi:hypothetical protein